jgi:hypothetical protein
MRNKWLGTMLILLGMLALLASCGGGGNSDPVDPDIFNPDDRGQGGDPQDPTIAAFGDFTLPGGASYADVRGIAASTEYVYVIDSALIYCFDKLGRFVNAAPVGEEARAVAVFPPAPQNSLIDDNEYLYANLPIVAHEPIAQWGYMTIFNRTLSPGSNRPDAGNPDLRKLDGLPNAQIVPPLIQGTYVCINVYDVAVDRYGSVYVVADIDIPNTDPFPDFPRALQVLNRFKEFTIEDGGEVDLEDPDNQDEFITVSAPLYHQTFGQFAGDFGDLVGPGDIGSLGTTVIDTYFPFNRTESTFTVYQGAANFERDYIGKGSITYNNATLGYTLSSIVDNPVGFNRVIGDSYGGGPSQFSPVAPRDPNGDLEDPDIAVGGPAGMAVDWRTDNLYVCDPGNRRVQIFDSGSGEFISQFGSGARGNSSSSYLAPSDVAIDLEGTVFIADADQMRVIRPSAPDRKYGGVVGTVRNLNTNDVIAGATVTLGNELGVIAVRTTDINGQYEIPSMLTGQYFMQCLKFNFNSDSTTVDILPETEIVANFNLTPNAPATLGSYGGVVIDDETALNIEDVTVTIANTSRSSTTDTIGSFFINDVPPGSYQVVFSHPDYVTLTKTIDISSGQAKFDNRIIMRPIS